MFCKNCGREIDQKTLKKLMEQKDGSVVCSKCKQPLDNAEMCGGFWGLIAASEEKEAAEAETVNMTVMLDENGKPVQMNPRMQNRSSSSIPDANLRMPENNYSSQNSRQTSGAGMSDSAPYEQKAPEMRIRRSSARKDTELWITRAIAVLLGIALIISLVTRCGKSDQPKDEMTESTEISDVSDNNSDAAVTPSDLSEDSQGAPDEEPEAVTEEKEEQAEDAAKKEEAERAEGHNTSENTNTGVNEEETSEEPSAGMDAAAVLQPQKQYNTLKRTIEIDENGWNLQSKVEMITQTGKNVIIRWEYKGKKNSPNEQISIEKGIKDGRVEKKYVSEEIDTSDPSTVYTYKNGYLESEKRFNNGKISGQVSYETRSNTEVREIYSQPQEGLKPDGTQFEYTIVEKAYVQKPDGTASNVLDQIDYYKNNMDKSPVLHIDYTDYTTTKDAMYEDESYDSWEVYTKAEVYSDKSGRISLKVGDYEYDEIRYTYGKVDGMGEPRLLKMGYYFHDVPTIGPNGFSYFFCDYDGFVRTDYFCDEYGNEVPFTAEDPFLSKAVIPAYYAEEFPYLTGRPGINPDAEEDIQKKMKKPDNADEGRSDSSNNPDSQSKNPWDKNIYPEQGSGGSTYGNQ